MCSIIFSSYASAPIWTASTCWNIDKVILFVLFTGLHLSELWLKTKFHFYIMICNISVWIATRQVSSGRYNKCFLVWPGNFYWFYDCKIWWLYKFSFLYFTSKSLLLQYENVSYQHCSASELCESMLHREELHDTTKVLHKVVISCL